MINAMFIGPLPRGPAPYPCATSGRTATGGGGKEAVLRDDGSVVPDQKDTVHRAPVY
ncbi:hypothetical protein [Streptomyces sp. NPDC090798]|uniref:hypothetical protein n=1 Tax=Streptomyces sp. NPDC090798 TaxID=3365968 RepID=UPI0038005C51